MLLPDGVPIDELKAIQCNAIYNHVLQKFYGMKLNESRELVYPVTDPQYGHDQLFQDQVRQSVY